MSRVSEQVLERFHRALIEEIQTQRPEYLTSSFTVAEIYQNLVPYGSHRDRIGVEMNGDYEDALLRLLAGEGGYLILDSETALKELRAELGRANPNTGLYREFAAVDVRLNPAYLELSASALDQLPDLVHELEADDPVTMAALAPSEETSELGIVPPGADIFADDDGHGSPPPEETDTPLGEDEPLRSRERPPLAPEYVEEPRPNGADAVAPPPAGEGDEQVAVECKWCRAELPRRDNVNFCPYCGTDVLLVPCRSCSAEIEPGWRFCAACGIEVGD
jgi:hypothetical protein